MSTPKKNTAARGRSRVTTHIENTPHGPDANCRYSANEAQDRHEEKQFSTLRAKLALMDHTLHRSDRDDGPRVFFIARKGIARELRDLTAVARFLDQVGGVA